MCVNLNVALVFWWKTCTKNLCQSTLKHTACAWAQQDLMAGFGLKFSDSQIQGLQAQIKVNRLSMNHGELKPLFSAKLTQSGAQP